LRRLIARNLINSKPPGKTTTEDLWALLSIEPCLAHDTVYTVAMQPSTGYYVTRVKVTEYQEDLANLMFGNFVRNEFKELRRRK